MRKTKLCRSLIACVLTLAMIISTCATTFATIPDLDGGSGTIDYVSFGASNVNGYGLTGYLPEGITAAEKATANVFGYDRCPEGSYVDLIRDDLVRRGYTVNVAQRAISSMRVEELRILLDEDYYGDSYSDWRFIGPGKWFENAAVTGGLDALRADCKAAIEDAELITVDIGVNNFGVYLSNQIQSGGTAYDDDLALVDPEIADTYNKAKAYVYDLIAEHAGEYSSAVASLDFAVDAMAYALAGFCYNFDIVMEKIYELNPEATVVAVSIQNLMEGLEATLPGVEGTVPFGELFGALVDAANLYIAVGSPYSSDYLFADVSENGRVEFFLEQLLAYDGDPATLDRDMRDCFDLYDDDLMLSTRVNEIAEGFLAEQLEPYAATYLSPIYGETEPAALLAAVKADAANDFAIAEAVAAAFGQEGAAVVAGLRDVFTTYNTLRPLVFETAYDVVAEIMQLGARNNVLDLAAVLAGGFGSIENDLLDVILGEGVAAIDAVVADPSYTYTIDEDFFAEIASAAGVPESLLSTVATLGIRTGIGNSFYGHPNRNGHREIAATVIDALETGNTGFAAVLERLDITDEYNNAVLLLEHIETEIEDIIDVFENGSCEEKIALVKEAIDFLKTELNVTAEEEAAVNAIIDKLTVLADEIRAIVDVAQNGTDAEKEALVKEAIALLKAELGITAEDEAVANEIIAKIKGIIDIAQNGTDEEKEALVKEAIDFLKAEFGITAEDEAKADEIIGEIKDIIDVAQNGTYEEKEALIMAYFELLKAELGITTEDEAKVAEFAAIAADIIEIIENTSEEDVKVAIDAYLGELKAKFAAEFAKLGHRHYAADENSYYVAIGADTLDGKGVNIDDLIAGTAKRYSDLVKTSLGIANGAVVKQAGLLPTDVVDLIVNNAGSVAAADLITYQLDASAFVNGLFSDEEIVWDNYIDPETADLLETIIEEATAILTADWAAYANAEIDEILAAVLPRVQMAILTEIAKVQGEIEGLDEELYNVIADLNAKAQDAVADLGVDAKDLLNKYLGMAQDEISEYIGVEIDLSIVNEYVDTVQGIIAGEITEANGEIVDIITQVQRAIAEYFDINIDTAEIDRYIALGIDAVKSAIELINNEKDAFYAENIAPIVGLDEMVIGFAEKIAYTVVSFAAETVKAVEAIETINPDATLLVLGMYNPLKNLQVVVEGKTYNVGDMFESVIDLTNVFYYAVAAIDGGFAFVDVSDAEANGFEAPVVINDIETAATDLVNILRNADDYMHTDAAGHVYIKDQIVKALTCDYSVYEQYDADYHYVICSICGDAKLEEHDGEDSCSLCGYVKPVVPPVDPEEPPVDPEEPGEEEEDTHYYGGGVSSNKFTIKFDTNGGSAVANVTVKKGELLAKPADPTKAGFVFDGWYTDKALTKAYDFSTPVTKSFTLYAKWTDLLSMFTDLNKDAWYYEYVKAIVERGLMIGISETEFGPDLTLTRGMFVTILYRVEGQPEVEDGATFTDVPADQYYAKAVQWANANGIVKGISETEFAPNTEVTREQMAAIIARYAEFKKLEVAEGDVTYTDSDMISEYAQSAVKVANKLGVLIGNADGSFAPKKNATRAEAAALFVRLLGVLEK